MAVDFAYKRRTRAKQGAAIRNIKLRMSRKLIYVSGLLSCFAPHLELPSEERANLFDGMDAERRFVEFFRVRLKRTPLETLASVFSKRHYLDATALKVLNASNGFLGTLLDPEARKELDGLTGDEHRENPLYEELRKHSHAFRDGLLDLFFGDDPPLAELARMYGFFNETNWFFDLRASVF